MELVQSWRLTLLHQAFSGKTLATSGLKCAQSSSFGMEGWVYCGAGVLQLVFSLPIIWGAFVGG